MKKNSFTLMEEFLKRQTLYDQALREMSEYLYETDKGKYLFEKYIKSKESLSLARLRFVEEKD